MRNTTDCIACDGTMNCEFCPPLPDNVIRFPTPIVNRDPGDESDYPDAA